MWNGWFYFVACITNSWYIVESFVYVGTCSKHQKVCITLDFVKQNQIFALMFYVFSVMCSWLGSYKAKMKILLEMRHQLHQRKFFNFWIRFSPEEVGIFFFLSFFLYFFNNIHFGLHFVYVVCRQYFGGAHLMWKFTVWVIHSYISSVSSKVYSLLFQTIEALYSVPAPELSLCLYLQCAEVHGTVWFINIWNTISLRHLLTCMSLLFSFRLQMTLI